MVSWPFITVALSVGCTVFLYYILYSSTVPSDEWLTIRSLSQRSDLFEMQRENAQSSNKWLTVPFTHGRLGNQLYHLISGFCIAKQLNRKFYVPYEANETDFRDASLEQVNLIFPRFQSAYELKVPNNEKSVANAGTSFDFVDPLQYINESTQLLRMNIRFGQNWNYFRSCEMETRQLLTFADSIAKFGEHLKRTKNLHFDSNYTCAHIRRTDFKLYGAESTLPRTTALLEYVISQKKSRRVALFGDDKTFMRQVVKHLENNTRIDRGVSYVSTYSEATDFYIASEICSSLILTSPASSFGFWLAFLTRNQSNVYYYFTDKRFWKKKLHTSKFPSSWTALRVNKTDVWPSESN